MTVIEVLAVRVLIWKEEDLAMVFCFVWATMVEEELQGMVVLYYEEDIRG